MSVIRLVVGLGNPGPGFEDNRHSAGFWFVDRLAQDAGLSLRADGGGHGTVALLRSGDSDCWLLKPLTDMSLCGMAVLALAQRYQIRTEEILVVHDELDLPPGTVRLKCGGGDAGHEGLRDMIKHLTASEFWRLRIGIGDPGDDSRVSDYLLQPPGPAQRSAIDAAIDRALLTWPMLQAGQGEAAMLALHTDPGSGPRGSR